MRAYGHVKISRKFFETRWRTKTHWDDADALLDLIQRAAWGDREIRTQAGVIRLGRGEILVSVTALQREWKWSRGATARFVKKLEQEGFWVPLRTYHRVGTVYRIVTWQIYQDNSVVSEGDISDNAGTHVGTHPGTQKASKQADSQLELECIVERKLESTRRKIKKEKNDVERDVLAVFEFCAELHAQRRGHTAGPRLQLTDARKSKIRARLREGFTVEQLKDAATAFYADDWEGRDRYLDPARYLYRDDETVRKWLSRKEQAAPERHSLAAFV